MLFTAGHFVTSHLHSNDSQQSLGELVATRLNPEAHLLEEVDGQRDLSQTQSYEGQQAVGSTTTGTSPFLQVGTALFAQVQRSHTHS